MFTNQSRSLFWHYRNVNQFANLPYKTYVYCVVATNIFFLFLEDQEKVFCFFSRTVSTIKRNIK